MRFITGLLCVLALACAGAVSAAESQNICLHLKTGEKVVMKFDSKTSLSFGDNNAMTLRSAGKVVKVCEFDQLQKVSFGDAAGINDVVSDADGKFVYSTPDDLSLIGFKPGTQVNVVSASGVALLTATIETSEPYIIRLDNYAKGVYIVSAGKLTYKIAIK